MSIKTTSVNSKRLGNSGATTDNDSDQGLTDTNGYNIINNSQGLPNGASKMKELPLEFIPSSLLFVL